MIKIDAQWDADFVLRKLQTARLSFEDLPKTTLREIGKLWREQAKEESPVDTGKLSKSWGYRVRDIGREQSEMVLQNKDPDASYKLYKTRPHIITGKNGKALSNGQFAFRRVRHPGTKGTNVFKILRDDVSLNVETLGIVDSALKRLADKL